MSSVSGQLRCDAVAMSGGGSVGGAKRRAAGVRSTVMWTVEDFLWFLHVCVCVCASVSGSQSLRPPWQVCGPSPPLTSPSAVCPWPLK